MSSERSISRLRGAFGSAVVFGIGWAVAAFSLWLPLRQAGVLPKISILSGVGIAIRFGVMGFITGAVFPSIMRLAYRGKRLSEISWVRFGIVGGIAAGLFVPTFMQTMNVLSGAGMVPFALIRMDIVWTAGLGALISALSLKLAQYAERRFPPTVEDHLNRWEKDITRLEEPKRWYTSATRRSSSAESLKSTHGETEG